MVTGSSKLLLFLIVVTRRVPVPHAWPQKLSVAGCAINQSCIDVQEMNPNFVVAALVCNFDAKYFVRNFERTMHALSFGPRWLDESTHVGPSTWYATHRGVGPGKIGKFVLAKASSTVLLCRCSLPDCRHHAAPLKSPATMSTCP